MPRQKGGKIIKVKQNIISVFSGFLLVLSSATWAEVISVDTVEELEIALATAQSNGENDTINISAGTYDLTARLNYTPSDDPVENYSLTIQSTGGQVILDGDNTYQILKIKTLLAGHDTSSAHIIIEGITFRNGRISYNWLMGAGSDIWTHNSDITIENSEFIHNIASGLFDDPSAAGAFIKAAGSGTVTLIGNTFSGNSADNSGGGAYILSNSVTLVNNVFSNNEASVYGGGAYIYSIAAITVINNTFSDNEVGWSGSGGGIYVHLYSDDATADIYNNIIWGNTTTSGTGQDLYLANDGDSSGTGATVNLYNNDFSDLDYQVRDNLSQGDNIDQDPLLTGDFHIIASSPVIDAGDNAAPSLPDTDFEGNERVIDGDDDGTATVDMGADEYLPPTPTPPPTSAPISTSTPSPTPTPPAEVSLIVCLGDSVTHGYPYADNGNTYPARLSDLLEAEYGPGSFAIDNQGVNGYKAEDVVNVLSQPDALSGDPDYVLLMVGGNDLAGATYLTILPIIEETTWEVQSCVDLANAHVNGDGSHPKVIVSAFIPNLLEGGWGTVTIDLYNQSLEENLSGYALWFTDNWDDFYDSGTGEAKISLMYDLVHPNIAGYEVMAENWFNALQGLLVSPTPTPPPAPSPSITPTTAPPPATPTPSPAGTPIPLRATVTPTPTVAPVLTPTASPVESTTPHTITPTPVPSMSPPAATPVPQETPTPEKSPTPFSTPTCGPPVVPPGFLLESGDYNGDGTSDIAVFRKTSGLWAIRGITRIYFGGGIGLPVSGDYDGDGTTDPAIFQSSSGLWAIRGISRFYFGADGDLPVSADYDGNGTADIAIFRDGIGLWAVRGVTRIYFAGRGDMPVPGDYDGSGSAGFAVFRPCSGLWAIRDEPRVYFGAAGDWPVPRDYDEDGRCDIAIFRPCSGLWAIHEVSRIYYGTCVDYPVIADYDGDGISNIGIFRQDCGLWSVPGLTRIYFGAAGDIPVTR